MRDRMQIGELASRVGLNPKTIRYYEAIGLLPPAARTESGYRRYDEHDAHRLAFIQRAKVLGLRLEDIRDLLALSAGGDQPCPHVLALIDAKIADVERRIAELQAFRSELTQLRADWSDRRIPSGDAAEPTAICPIIQEQTAVAAHSGLARVLDPLTCHR